MNTLPGGIIPAQAMVPANSLVAPCIWKESLSPSSTLFARKTLAIFPDEFLCPFSDDVSGIDVALRIDCEGVDPVEVAG